LGKREPTVYGNQSFEGYLVELKGQFGDVEIDYFQSNTEGEIIDKLHEVGFTYDGIVINAGAYTHTSIAIADAIRSIQIPVIEVHISNVFKREDYRHHSYLSEACKGCIVGFGMDSYRLAVDALLHL
jgi:3-dehydroquinate dehydratase-2